MFVGSRLLASHISSWCSSWLGPMVSGMLKAMMLYICGQNWVFGPSNSQILCWLSVFAVRVAAASVSILIVVPPLLVLVREWILPSDRPVLVNILFSSVLSCNVWRWERLDLLMPSMWYCLSAIFGLACGGGLIMLRQVYKQAFTNITSLRAAKKFLRFRVNACIDSTKGKNKLKNYCTECMGLYT